jgi:dolichol-phosphate mannosyltransferase
VEDKPHTSVVVPCWNECESLPEAFERLEAMVRSRPGWEILFVDDGSTDGTRKLLEALVGGSPWAGVLTHAENLGLGAALKTGFSAARGDIICTMDSDCTYPPERMDELVDAVERGADIATASPWHPDAKQSGTSGFRFFVSRCASRVHSLALGRRIYTLTSLFRAYSARVLADITPRSNGFGAVAETLVRAALAGYRIHEVPMPVTTRRHGVSKMNLADAVGQHLLLLLQTIAWRLSPAAVAPERSGRGV